MSLENNYFVDPKISSNISEYLEEYQNKDLLKFISCGSVDDGKSTLIGRLLFESKQIFDDHFFDIKDKNNPSKIDFSLLVDGLSAEREQGITIDVAYRFFSTSNRRFIVIDAPGHEQYTRNMFTGASNAELSLILIDAKNGVLPQTRRHFLLCSLLGIKKFIVAINKMDLVNYSQEIFKDIVSDFKSLVGDIEIESLEFIPISGTEGDNFNVISASTPWYTGKTLISLLETAKLDDVNKDKNFSMPVQWVNRPDHTFRGYLGRISSGSIKVGDEIKILPSGSTTKIKEILLSKNNKNIANKYESITLTFDTEVDCSRGDVIVNKASPLQMSDIFDTTIIWLTSEKLLIGREYFFKIGTSILKGKISKVKNQIDINTLSNKQAKNIGLNDICSAEIILDRNIPFSEYKINKELGGFIVIDKLNNNTVGAGLINFSLFRGGNIFEHKQNISKVNRAEIKQQEPCLIWLTGISGAGKSTIANILESKLHNDNYHTYLLDGDNVRLGLNKNLGFTETDRIENIRRIGEVSKLMIDARLIVISAFISPFIEDRDMVRKLLNNHEFIEVFVDTDLEVAEERDVKGLYAKARKGLIKNFTGIDSPYEIPKNPEIHIKTSNMSAEEAAQKIYEYIFSKL